MRCSIERHNKDTKSNHTHGHDPDHVTYQSLDLDSLVLVVSTRLMGSTFPDDAIFWIIFTREGLSHPEMMVHSWVLLKKVVTFLSGIRAACNDFESIDGLQKGGIIQLRRRTRSTHDGHHFRFWQVCRKWFSMVFMGSSVKKHIHCPTSGLLLEE